jgi:hypothetical protein
MADHALGIVRAAPLDEDLEGSRVRAAAPLVSMCRMTARASVRPHVVGASRRGREPRQFEQELRIAHLRVVASEARGHPVRGDITRVPGALGQPRRGKQRLDAHVHTPVVGSVPQIDDQDIPTAIGKSEQRGQRAAERASKGGRLAG